MNSAKTIVYILLIVIIIAAGQYYKTQFESKPVPVTPAPVVEEVKLLPVKKQQVADGEAVDHAPNEKAQLVPQENPALPTGSFSADQAPVENSPVAPSSSKAPQASSATAPEASSRVLTSDINKSPVPVAPKLADIDVYLPEKAGQTKEEKIAEIKSLGSIFRAHLEEMYKNKVIDYIPPENDKINVLLGDAVEYYSDPVEFEKKSTPSFVKSTMEFIDNLQRLRRESHQRYVSKHGGN